MSFRFNTPPGWPPPPEGWIPPADWKPDASWPPAPGGWQWWVPIDQPAPSPQPPAQPALPAVPVILGHVTPASASSSIPPPRPSGGLGRIFGGKRLEAENDALRREIARLMGMDVTAIAAETAMLQAELAALRQQQEAAVSELNRLRACVVDVSEVAALQEVGIYEYQHPLADAVAYKARLAAISDRVKVLARGGNSVLTAQSWTVNGSVAAGRKMLKETSTLMLRAYNAEADSCVATVRPHRLHSTIDRLNKVVETIARLGRTMEIRIAPQYHQLRIEEIQLAADYRAKVEEEKERVREERERQREEAVAQREFEREKARLEKERSHYSAALEKLRTKGDTDGAAKLEAKLGELADAIAGVEAREANIRAGYVYVISNVGAFGPNMVKIGMTRRLEPEDRIRELGDASVPFRFDAHALIFSEDAVGLEGKLHNALAAERVNKVNPRREFFYADALRVRDLLKSFAGEHLLEFRETPEALEWRASKREDPEK